MKVNRYIGLFFFDSGFRPVPLKTEYIGVKARGMWDKKAQMDDACFDTVLENVRNGEQVMIFVHARNETTRTPPARLIFCCAHIPRNRELLVCLRDGHAVV